METRLYVLPVVLLEFGLVKAERIYCVFLLIKCIYVTIKKKTVLYNVLKSEKKP